MKVYKIVESCPEIEEILEGQIQYVEVEEEVEFFRIIFQTTYCPEDCYGGATYLDRSKKTITEPESEPLFKTELSLRDLMNSDVDEDWVCIYEEGGYYPHASVEFENASM